VNRIGRSIVSRRAIAVVAALVCLPATARAHNPDTSYARFQIARESVISTFTYDVTSLVRIVPGLDADGDARLSEAELRTGAPRITDFLRKTIRIQIDRRDAHLGEARQPKWPAASGESIPEKDYHAATSLVAFEFAKSLERAPADIWYQFEFFDTLGLRHTVLAAFEHEGAKDEVLFTPFEPDYLYETKYAPEAEPGATAAMTPPATADTGHGRTSDESLVDRLKLFFRFGVEHILIGYDHILFLLSLIVVSRFRELVKIVTSFTVAHSLTLGLATAGWVRLPSNLVETAIAATIVYTAAENFWIRDTSGRWKLTFVFGLIHGFGFAGILAELDLPAEGFFRSLLAFNLGVEAGQLAIVAVPALPCAWIAKRAYGRKVQLGVSAIVGLCGVGWFLDRAFELGLMPF
jgi:hypothetical protein